MIDPEPTYDEDVEGEVTYDDSRWDGYHDFYDYEPSPYDGTYSEE